MKNIAFIDTEIDFKSRRVLDIGGVTEDGLTFHGNPLSGLSGDKLMVNHNGCADQNGNFVVKFSNGFK